ncbi:MAG: LapA family protein [Plesiomonas sp.]|uniref:LapA family protein n=1 Tax=Plesiomonas sp. TaxID=2486279 RepID=UPI003F383715
MKYLLGFLIALALFIIGVTFGAQNETVVTFNYLLAQGEFRLSSLLAMLFGTGFVLGWVICGLFYLRVRFSLSRAHRQIKRQQEQLDQHAAATPVVEQE